MSNILIDDTTGKAYTLGINNEKVYIDNANAKKSVDTILTDDTTQIPYKMGVNNGKVYTKRTATSKGNVSRLPDAYKKGYESNNYKMLHINELAVADLQKDIVDVEGTLDLNQATGETLNMYGDMLGQKRGALNDEQYRYMIYSMIGRNNVRGDYNSILQSLALMFNCSISDIELSESDEPCKVVVSKFPLAVLLNAGFSSTQAVKMIELVLPICVSTDSTNFEGTFEFADSETEYSETAGFADLEQTIGGYLGLLAGDDENAPILPI